MKIQSLPPTPPQRTPVQTKCTGPFEDHAHDHFVPSGPREPEPPLPPSPAGVSEKLRQEVVDLTRELVQVNSGPDNLVAGELEVVTRMERYAREAGLQTDRVDSVNGRQLLVITLPGSDPQAGSVGFVHHTDVVQPEGEWKLGEPFSAKLTQDEAGREIIVGRGTVDTKGPAAQVLVALKHLKETGQQPARSMKLFMFPDEEFGGKEGAWLLSREKPELFQDVQYWVVEGSGVFTPEFVGGILGPKDVPYLAMAQKYTIPMQLLSKTAKPAQETVEETQAALQRADEFIEARPWTYLGDKSESKEAMKRMGKAIGGFKGFMIRHFWNFGFMQKKMGKGNAAANRTDFCKTDFYLEQNTAGKPVGTNVKPSSASMLLELKVADREKALAEMRKEIGPDLKLLPADGDLVRLTLPQENYHGGNHGSTADRDQDAVDVVLRAYDNIKDREGVTVKDIWTSKSQPAQPGVDDETRSRVTLDLRVAVDEDPRTIIGQLSDVMGPDFELKPLVAPGEFDAKVRRLSHKSPLFQAAEQSAKTVYGQDAPVLFGNTTASNDTRFLMEANPHSETLTFVPIMYTRHGAHGPDEAVTVRSLKQGVDWVADLMKRL
jgi:acetylornithine deacetylase/succinyl-diaminopimelate desuccinylase-like protein